MKEVIDFNYHPPRNKYIKKSATVYKVYGVLVAAFIVLLVIAYSMQGTEERFWNAFNFVLMLQTLSLFVAAPIGLVNALRAYAKGESSHGTRLLHLSGHIFSCLLILAIITLFIMDVSRFL